MAKGPSQKTLNAVNSIALPLLRQWVAGLHKEDALQQAKVLNKRGATTIINYLVEHSIDEAQVEKVVEEYGRLVKVIRAEGVKSAISLKPSQFGFDLPGKKAREHCYKNIERTVSTASKHKIFTWIDMEYAEYTDFTLSTYSKLLRKTPLVGVTLQARLRRTKNDLKKLLASKGKHRPRIRLTKGIYKEPAEIAYTEKTEIDEGFKQMVATSLKQGNTQPVYVATHDEKIIEYARRHKARHTLEIQVLYGVRMHLQHELEKERVPLAVYLPYGPNALPYSVRRSREAMGNINYFLVRRLLGPLYDSWYKK